MPGNRTRVSEVLKHKERVAFTIRPEDTIEELSNRLKNARVGVMVVSEDGQTIDGIISERDIAYNLGVYKAALHVMPVSSIMTTKVITCAPDDDLGSAIKTMSEKHIRHLPVVENGHLAGVIGMRDAMLHRLRNMEEATRFLGQALAED